MRVGQLCNRTVYHVGRKARVVEAARRMRAEHVGDLVVVDDTNGHLVPVGILTDRDLVLAVLAQDVEHIQTLDVGDVMRESLVTATEDEDLSTVLRRMHSFGVRRVPIVDREGNLSGILSVDDIVAELSEEIAQVADLTKRQRFSERERRP